MRARDRESEHARRRVDQALSVLRRTLAEYLASLPRTRPGAFRDNDLQGLLKTFIARFDELRLGRRRSVLTLVHEARDARNEWAHDDGALTPERALHHLSTVRQLLETLGAEKAFEEVDGLYREQLRVLAGQSEPVASARAEAAPAATGQTSHHVADTPKGRRGGTSQADGIRAFAAEQLVEAARRAGMETLSIRAGDVGTRLALSGNMPNVCSALGGSKFEALAGVTLVGRSGPNAGANAVFRFAINHSPSSGGTARPQRTGRPSTTLPKRPRPVPASQPAEGNAAPVLPPRTALVFPCAAAKVSGAGRMREAGGSKVYFVGDPEVAPADRTVVYRRPDDLATDGASFRDALEQYNQHTGGNRWGLLPAWQLYRHPVYRRLVVAVGTSNLFILSAGWGLIRSDYLTPAYDITFSVNADGYKRRRRQDRYEDFRQLDAGTYDRVVFAGGSDYQHFFLSLTDGAPVERVVYHNSARTFETSDARRVRFETRTKTNWHYEWAERLLDGTLALPA